MITAEISRFMDEDVHRSAYVVCLGQCGWVQWFGILTAVWHKLLYVWQWSSKTSCQRLRCNARMTSFFCGVNLHWRAAETLSRAYYRPIYTFLGEFDPLNVFGRHANPKKALPCMIVRNLSHCAWKSVHRSLQ